MTLIAPKPPEPPKYLTYLPTRNPKFKTHTHIGHVKNAIRGGRWYKDDIFAYQLIDGIYEVMWTIPGGMPLEDFPWETKLPKNIPAFLAKKCTHPGCVCGA